MKRVILTVLGSATLLVACNNETKNASTNKDSNTTTTASATDAVKTEDPWVPIDSAAMMKAMTDAATPGPIHKMVASWNGNWNTEITFWMKPGDPPMISKGTAVNSTIMNDLYQNSKFSGNMMGAPFQGIGTMGYDNIKKEFVSTWIDNMGSGIMYLTGPWDEATKTISLAGTVPHPLVPGKECKIRETFKIVDDNTQIMEMYGPDPATGKEYKSMELKLTRKK
jgi:hypothetical protein